MGVCLVGSLFLLYSYKKGVNLTIVMIPMLLFLIIMEIKLIDFEGVSELEDVDSIEILIRRIMLVSYITATILIIGQNFNNRFYVTYFVYIKILVVIAVFILRHGNWDASVFVGQLINFVPFVICFPIIGHLFNHCIFNLMNYIYSVIEA